MHKYLHLLSMKKTFSRDPIRFEESKKFIINLLETLTIFAHINQFNLMSKTIFKAFFLIPLEKGYSFNTVKRK